jgi:hypothetical protein
MKRRTYLKTMLAGAAVAAAPAAAVPKTRVATPAEAPGAVRAPAAAKSKMPMLVGVAVVVIAAIGGTVVMMNKGAGAGGTQAPTSAAPAGGDAGKTAAEDAKKGDAGKPAPVNTSPKGAQPMSKIVTPPTDVRRKEDAPVTLGTGASAAPVDFAVKWKAVFDGEEIGSAEARKLIAEVGPIADGLSGERQGIAYYLLGMAHLQLQETAESCGALRKAKPLVKGNLLTTLNLAYDGNCK